MALEISPNWDPNGTLSVRVDRERGELCVHDDDEEVMRFALCERRAERLGWYRRAPGRARRVAVAEVLAHCLRAWDAEQEVLHITRAAADRAARRGGAWQQPARRLRAQAASARRAQRVATLPFRRWWQHASDQRRLGERALSLSQVALRAGYVSADGRADVTRLQRRLGLAAHRSAGRPAINAFVTHDTALTLCRALERDPVELGL